ncbi:MAG: slipin family protein [Acidobacteria bacterium]|nr:slipin family protein [Acidobacteriota bacterium]
MYIPIIFLIMFVIVLSGIRIAQEYERGIVFRLGRFSGVKGPGLYWLIPLIEWQFKIDIRTNTMALEQQETITKDSVTIRVDAALWYKVVDPARAIINISNYRTAVHQIAQSSLRNVIGQHPLDEVLKERDKINAQLRSIVDSSTASWGIKVEMVEMKEVEIPAGMQRAMAREAEAVREKRARIIKAEAEFEASEKLALASQQVAQFPGALELRRMQMVSEVGAENNSTTIILMPSDFISAAQGATKALDGIGNLLRSKPFAEPRLEEQKETLLKNF